MTTNLLQDQNSSSEESTQDLSSENQLTYDPTKAQPFKTANRGQVADMREFGRERTNLLM